MSRLPRQSVTEGGSLIAKRPSIPPALFLQSPCTSALTENEHGTVDLRRFSLLFSPPVKGGETPLAALYVPPPLTGRGQVEGDGQPPYSLCECESVLLDTVFEITTRQGHNTFGVPP